jgi:hypothetical protein
MLLMLEVADWDLFLWRGVSYRPEGSGCTCGIFTVLGTIHRKGEYSVEGVFSGLIAISRTFLFFPALLSFSLSARKVFIATKLNCF